MRANIKRKTIDNRWDHYKPGHWTNIWQWNEAFDK
jgi:hypothetical protein